MKYFPFFEKVEERFHFKISHFFWHVLTALGGLALLTGVLVLLWGIIPAFKPSVDKPVYPEPVKVTAEEITQQLLPPAKRAELAQKPPDDRAVQKPEAAKLADADERAYLSLVDSMKVLLPADRYPWESRGRWEQTYWERRWVVTVLGVQDRLNSAFQRVNANDFKSKKQLLDAYISLVVLFPLEQRLTVLKAAIDLSKENVVASSQDVSLLRATVPVFSTDNADFVEVLATFGRKNPRDGRPFIEYTNSILPHFAAETRRPILNALVSAYYSYFNDIDRQREGTDLFLAMQKSFPPEDHVKALTEYYRLFVEKNAERRRQVARIEENYARAESEAEATLAERGGEKASYRSLSLQVIAGSVVFISLVAMFLVLLSIQRNVKMIRETSGSGGAIR